MGFLRDVDLHSAADQATETKGFRVSVEFVICLFPSLRPPKGRRMAPAFGASAPVEALYPHFGITAEKVAEAAKALL